MNFKDNSLIIFAGLIFLTLWLIGGFSGYEFGGNLFAGASQNDSNIITFAVSGFAFLFSMLSFQVQDVPWFLSGIIDFILAVCIVLPVLKIVRGTSN